MGDKKPEDRRKDARFGRALRAALLVAAILPAPSAARDRIDVVELLNGGRVICEIISLEFGILSARTLGLGSVQIDWVDVASLVSVQRFDVQLDDGTRISGHLDVGTTPGNLLVRTGDDEWLEVPFDRVFLIRQLGATFWQSRRGRLNVGLDYAHASDTSDFSLDGELTFQGENFRWVTVGTASISDEVLRERREREQFGSQIEVALGSHFEWVARASFQKNDDLALDSRVTAAAALVWVPLRSGGKTFLFGAGAGQSEERYRGEPEAQGVTAGLVFAGFEIHRFGDYGTRAAFELDYIPMLTGPSRHRVEFRSSVIQKFTTHFNLTISPYYSFDSRPPRANAETEDWGWISSIGWSF